MKVYIVFRHFLYEFDITLRFEFKSPREAFESVRRTR